MNIIVCIKQVPGSTNLLMDEKDFTLKRDSGNAVMNIFDQYALEEGVRIKEKLQCGKVMAISMGMLGAETVLKEAIGLGADEGILLSDKAFAGADTLATSYTLSKGIHKLGMFDLIICGKQAIDGDTAQVGPSLAECLQISQIINVKEILEIDHKSITCKSMTDEGYMIVKAELPALITVVKDINIPRTMNIRNMIKSKNADITVWSLEQIEADENMCGRKGSPTQVIKTSIPNLNVKSEIIYGEPEEQVKYLANLLFNKLGCG